jgi:hypothetical protein
MLLSLFKCDAALYDTPPTFEIETNDVVHILYLIQVAYYFARNLLAPQ